MERLDMVGSRIEARMLNLCRTRDTEPYQPETFMPKFGIRAIVALQEAETPDDGYVPEVDMIAMIDDLMTRQARRKEYEARLAKRKVNGS